MLPERSQLRLAFVSHLADLGGAELVLLETAEAMRNRGHKIFVVLPSDGPLRRRLDTVGAETVVIPMAWWVGHWGLAGRLTSIIPNVLAARRLIAPLRQFRPDALISNTLTIPVGAMAALGLRVPHIWWIHEFDDLDQNLGFDFYPGFAARFMDFASALVLTNSDAVTARFAKYIRARKLRRLYYFIRSPDITEAPDICIPAAPPPRCVFVGRLHPNKGQHEAIRAIGTLRKTGTLATLHIVGPGPGGYRRELEGLAAAEGCADSVFFHGSSKTVSAVMRQATLVLVCSRNEALGRVTIEAMRVGAPVIATASGGTTELVRHMETGFLYPPGDVGALAYLIKYALENPAIMRRVAAAGQQWASSRFLETQFVIELEEILFQMARKRKGSFSA